MAKPQFKKLSIQVHLNGLSFCVLDSTSDTVVHLKSVDFNNKVSPIDLLDALKEELSSHSIYAQDFQDVIIIHHNELAVLVPEELFDENNKADYLKFNSKILGTDFIATDKIDVNNSINVYVPYVNINNYIFDTFGSFIFKHASTVLIESLLIKHKTDDTVVFVNLNKESFELLVLGAGSLKLYNYFEYSCPEDFIYYILFVYEQLGLDVESTPLQLTGEISTDSPYFLIVFKYVRHVTVMSMSLKIKLPKALDSGNAHEHYIILNSFV